MKNPVEVQPPSGDRLFVVLRVIMSGDHIPFTPLDDVPLDLVHSPDRELGEEITWRTDRWFNSPRQLLNRPEERSTELVRLSSIHSPIEGFADASAG